MVLDEGSRHALYLRLEEVLGPEPATTLMEMMPPVGWADVATKRDIDTFAAATKADLDALAAATKADLDAFAAATKRDIDALAAATKTDLDAFAAATKADLEVLRLSIDSVRAHTDHVADRIVKDIRGEMNSQLRSIYAGMMATMLGTATLSGTLAFVAARVV